MFDSYDSKRDTNFRWVLLCFSIFGGFVFAYSYDAPASIKDLLFEHFKSQYTEAEFEVRYSLLYSLMALPDIFMSIFLGFLIDKFRVRVNFWVLSIIVAVGTTVTYFGVAQANFFLMCAGRFLLGASGESIHIVEGLFLRMYFNPNEMSFIIAIVESFLSLGGFLSFLVSPRLAASSMVFTFAIANYMCIANAVLVILVCLYDKWFEWKNPSSITMTHLDEETEKLTHGIGHSEEVSPLKSSPERVSGGVEHRDVEQEGEEGQGERPEEEIPEESRPPVIIQEAKKKSYFSQVMEFPATYWYLLIAGATVLSSIQSFMMIGSSYILDKGILPGDLKSASVKAATFVSLFRLTAAITLPFFGYLIDLTGKRSLWLFIGTLITCANHILVIFIHPLPCCVLYGCCYAIVAASLWPSIYFIIPKRLLGIATALVSSIDNVGLMMYPAINGVIRAETGTYDNAMIFLAATTLMAAFAAYKSYALLRKEPDRKGSLVLSRRSSIVLKEYD